MSKVVERLRDLGAGRRDAIMLDIRIIRVEPNRDPRHIAGREARSPRRTEGQHQSARRAGAALYATTCSNSVLCWLTANVDCGPCWSLLRKA